MAIGFIVWVIVLGYIIEGATKSKRYIKLLESQVQLLTSTALKLGVSKDDIVKDTAEL